MTTYLRLFLVNTLDLVLYTYELCYSNCFYYKQPEHYIRRTNSNELELGTYGSPINIASQPLNIDIQNMNPINYIKRILKALSSNNNDEYPPKIICVHNEQGEVLDFDINNNKKTNDINIGYKIKDDLSMVEQRIDYLIFDSKTKEIIWINKNYNPSLETKREVFNMLKK